MLDSAHIPFLISRFDSREHLYVPPVVQKLARQELDAYIRENSAARPAFQTWPLYRHSWLSSLFLLPVIIVHGFRDGWWPTPVFMPLPDAWQTIGSLNAIQIEFHHQWERLVTALWLHAGISHLCGNLVFGALFMFFLARLCGAGHAALLTLLGGIAGNALSLLAHTVSYQSVGFSTAIFACIGAMAGIMSWRIEDRRKIFMPLIAALGLLAMLGAEGENSDYAAHICGLLSGSILGLLEGVGIKEKWPGLPQIVAGALAIAIPLLAWFVAFARMG